MNTNLPRVTTQIAIVSLLLVCATYTVNAMDRSVFPVLLPAVAKEYGFPLAIGGLLATLFTLGLGIAGLPGGFLFDRMSRKWVAIWGILIFSVCTMLTPLSVGFYDMAVYRVASGVGEGLQNAAIFTLAGAYFARNRTLAMGALNVAYGLGSFFAPRWGTSLMLQFNNWHMPMYVFGVVGIAGAAIMLVFVSKRFTEQFGLVTSVDLARESHVPPILFNRNIILLSLVSIGSGIGNVAFVGLYASFLRDGLHFSPTDTAGAFSMYGIGALMALPLGFVADRVSQKAMHLIAILIFIVDTYLVFNVATTVVAQSWLAFFEGVAASGILYVNGYSLMQRSVRAGMVGRASGLYVTLYYLAAASSGYVLGALKTAYGWGIASMVVFSGQLAIAFVLMLFFDMAQTTARRGVGSDILAEGEASA